jgi:hypothetical protein
MAVSVPPLVYQELVQSADAGYLNRQNSILLDRQAMPFGEFAMTRRKVVDMAQGIIRVGYQVSDTGENQGWTRGDLMEFRENMPTKGGEFAVYNEHRGLTIWDDDMMNAGYEVEFNSQSKTLASPLSSSEKTRLRNLIAEKVDNFRDAAKVSYDKVLHLDGTLDLKRTPGLDAALPFNRLGSYGNILRTDPKWQHYFASGLTYGLGGTLEEGMNTAFWNARLKSRGNKRGKYRIICGRGFADRYRRYARANNMHINITAEQVKVLDVNISDSGLRYMGIPLEIDPTFDDLDALYAPTIPWTNRCYILCEDTWTLGLFNKNDWSFSVAAPSAEVRNLKASLDWRQSFFCNNPNANAVVAAAA